MKPKSAADASLPRVATGRASGAAINPNAGDDSAPQPRSLFGEILDWMLAPLLLVWPLSIAATYLVAQSIADAPFDRNLETSVNILAQQLRFVDGQAQMTLPQSARNILRADDVDHIYYQVRGLNGALIVGDDEIPPPASAEMSPGTVHFRHGTLRGEEVRIAVLRIDMAVPPGAQAPLVQVAETLGKRKQLANEIIKGVILPQFVILPIAVVLVWFGLSRGIRPLSRLQERIQARALDDMRPIDPHQAPEEVAPLVASFNQLLQRLERNINDQKRFIADAAHQMRTPLAGLRTQAELALRNIEHDQPDPGEMQRSLQQLATGSMRATRLINQLLALARAENRDEARNSFGPVDLESLARDVVRELVPAALEKRIDLGLENIGEPVMVPGNAILLREMLKNLIDNAIRYTAAEGAVTVRVGVGEAGDDDMPTAILEVEDNGPGIPEAERPLVFERFYRVLGNGSDGSGLGLAIVREIAEQHGARVDLSANRHATDPQRPGTTVRVLLPRLPRPESPGVSG